MNYEEYLIKRDQLVNQIRDKLANPIERDLRVDQLRSLHSLFYDMMTKWDLASDFNVDSIRGFWLSIYRQQRHSWGYGCVMVKTIDEIIAEFPLFKEAHQRLTDKYYFEHESVTKYIDRILELGYLDLKIPEVVKEPEIY